MSKMRQYQVHNDKKLHSHFSSDFLLGFIKNLKSTLSGPGLGFIRIKFSSTDITLLNTYEFTLVSHL